MIYLQEYLTKSIGYNEYQTAIQAIVDANDPETKYLDYIRLNVQRMIRLNKTIHVLPELEAAVKAINTPQYWFVLSEGWCGDAAQTTPLMAKLAELNPQISLQFLWRDQNTELMDQFLTDGKSRSIPKLIATDSEGKVLFDWGPRPEELQIIYKDHAAKGTPFTEVAEILQKWYLQDKTVSTQKEILERL
ncbi:thioredoxin family protein [Gynurincola endophyticus]|uniref:thioredoxin family protein n=1 Tax=Gynurincola endophyticus TaxID=2479004 RepID=UPI000F8E2E3F|nr:thioredoxin family protein [Gynurincola endophyticus]